MPRIEECAKCGSAAVVQRAMAVVAERGTDVDLEVRADAHPSALVFKKSARSTVHAYLCSSCGYVEFYADDPKALYDAFLAAQQDTPQIT